MNSLTQEVIFVETPYYQGYHYNQAIGEWQVWYNGEIWTYAADEETAKRLYVQILQSNREHAERCPADYYGLEAVA